MKRKRRHPITGKKVTGGGRRLKDLAITRGNRALRPGAGSLASRRKAPAAFQASR